MKIFFNYATLFVAMLFLASCGGEDDPLGGLTPDAPVIQLLV
jgi:hypothetical protein